MSKTKQSIPIDIPTLSRWLVLDPKENVKALEQQIARGSADAFNRKAEAYRVSLKFAWDEQPAVFFPLLAPWLKSTNARLRRTSAGALPLAHPEYRDKCVRQLKKLIVDKDRAVRYVAIDLLAEEVIKNLDLVNRWVKDEDPAVRALIARHIQPTNQEDQKKILPILAVLVLDPEPDVHWAAASSLLELYDRDGRPVLEVARTMAISPDEDVRQAAASCFFEHVFADHFDQLLPTLRSWLRSGTHELRWTLVRSLRFIRISPRSLQLIRALYEDKDPEIRRRALLVLLDHFEESWEHRNQVRDLLRRAAHDTSKRVRDVIEEGERRYGEGFDQPEEPDEDEEE